MERILDLQNKINALLQDCRNKKAEIANKESFVNERKAAISSSGSIEKEKIRVQLSDLLASIQGVWYKIKEQCRKAKLSFNVDEFKTENLKVNAEDPLSTINSMLERFESEMQAVKSAYDVTPMTAFNANGLIYLIQRYLSNTSELDNAYYSGGRKDPESMRALDEIRGIEDQLADNIEQIFTLYSELKELVENYNAEDHEISDPVYQKTTNYTKPIKLTLGLYRGVKLKIAFDLESIPFELEELEVYDDTPYYVEFGNRNDNNEAVMFVLENEEDIEGFKSFIRDRISECYPEESQEIIEDVYDLDVGSEDDVLGYNVSHSDNPIKLQFLLIKEMEEFTNDFLIGQCFVIFVCSQAAAYRDKDDVLHIFDVVKLEDGTYRIIDSEKEEIKTL